MLEPVQPETFDYYWQQGWSKEMLLYLFVHRIQKGRDTYRNNPFGDTFDGFQKEIEGIANNECDLIVTEVSPDATIGPEIEAKIAAAGLQQLIELHKAGLTLTPAQRNREKADTYQLRLLKREYTIECRTGKDQDVSARYKVLPDSSVQNAGDKTADAKIYLRSPESILYYLGEIMRAEKMADNKIAKPPKLKGGKDKRCESWLFVAREAGAGDTNPFVAVDYEGTKYVIPRTDSETRCPEDVSSRVLSLVSLLTAKQSADNIPPPTRDHTPSGGNRNDIAPAPVEYFSESRDNQESLWERGTAVRGIKMKTVTILIFSLALFLGAGPVVAQNYVGIILSGHEKDCEVARPGKIFQCSNRRQLYIGDIITKNPSITIVTIKWAPYAHGAIKNEISMEVVSSQPEKLKGKTYVAGLKQYIDDFVKPAEHVAIPLVTRSARPKVKLPSHATLMQDCPIEI